MVEYTEHEMSIRFETAIKKQLIKGLPSFELLFKEVSCQQGIPDFVGLSSARFIRAHDFTNLVSTESSSIILSLLKHKAGRRKNYIKKKTNISDATLNRVLRELQSNNFIVERNNLYYLSVEDMPSNNTIWAFELKLSNWKRALFQALQYKAFANYSVVVFPFEKEKVLRKNLITFADFNVGILLFDSKSQKAKWLRRPQKEKSISKWQTLFLLGKISKQHSEEISLLQASRVPQSTNEQ